jgi:hypothetical protein
MQIFSRRKENKMTSNYHAKPTTLPEDIKAKIDDWYMFGEYELLHRWENEGTWLVVIQDDECIYFLRLWQTVTHGIALSQDRYIPNNDLY